MRKSETFTFDTDEVKVALIEYLFARKQIDHEGEDYRKNSSIEMHGVDVEAEISVSVTINHK